MFHLLTPFSSLGMYSRLYGNILNYVCTTFHQFILPKTLTGQACISIVLVLKIFLAF